MTVQTENYGLYTFQLVPIERHRQTTLFDKVLEPEDLIARKNQLFGELLSSFPTLRSNRHELVQKTTFRSPEWVIIKLASKHSLTRQQPNFQSETLDDWPHINLIICNDPEIQAIAISRNKRAFSDPSVVAQLLKENLLQPIEKMGLMLHIEPQFNKNHFWDLVEKYSGKITSVRFECVTPNMSRISHMVSEDLKDLAKNTNAQLTEVELKSHPESSLELNKDDKTVNDLLSYTSLGGGNISLKARGVRRTIRTATEVRETIIDELQFDTSNEAGLEMLKALLR